ncbi:MAG TPA: CDP-alcohol phosphatidyltransferase family protein [Kofleriaceae bacterium]|nr:CDP-alcohol phosphatidyltransferase family protein [Kofleriaceae bacterium]
MSQPPRTVVVDVPPGDRNLRRRIGGMSVLERTLRDAARAGATRAIVRAERADLPALPALALAVDVVAPGADLPAGAEPIPAAVVAGVEVTDDASARAATRALLQSCRRPYDGVGDRFVIRYVSLAITRVLTHTAATPNHVTLVNIAVGLTACAFATIGSRAAFALAGALIFLQVVLDSCDGELARIRHKHSKAGMILDNLSDDVIDNAFIACLGVGLGGVWAWLGIGAAAARALVAIMIYVDVARQGKFGDVMAFRWWFDSDDDTPTERFNARVTPLTVVRGLGRRDLYVLVFAASCLAGVPQVGYGLGLAICVGYAALAVIHLTRPRPARSA